MKFFNFDRIIENRKGEIATLLTIASVGLMVLGAVAGTKLAQIGTRFNPQAAGLPATSVDRLAECQKGVCDENIVGGANTGWCQAYSVRCVKIGDVVCQLPDPWCDSSTQGAPSICTGRHQKGVDASLGSCTAGSICGNSTCEAPMENWETCRADCAFSPVQTRQPPVVPTSPPLNDPGAYEPPTSDTPEGGAGSTNSESEPSIENGIVVFKGMIKGINPSGLGDYYVNFEKSPVLVPGGEIVELHAKQLYFQQSGLSVPLNLDLISPDYFYRKFSAQLDSNGYLQYSFGQNNDPYYVWPISTTIPRNSKLSANMALLFGAGNHPYGIFIPVNEVKVCFPFGDKPYKGELIYPTNPPLDEPSRSSAPSPRPTRLPISITPTPTTINAWRVALTKENIDNIGCPVNEINFDYSTYVSPTPENTPAPTAPPVKEKPEVFVNFDYNPGNSTDDDYIVDVSATLTRTDLSIATTNRLPETRLAYNEDSNLKFSDNDSKIDAKNDRSYELSFTAKVIPRIHNGKQCGPNNICTFGTQVATCSKVDSFKVYKQFALWEYDSEPQIQHARVNITLKDEDNNGPIDSCQIDSDISDIGSPSEDATEQSVENKGFNPGEFTAVIDAVARGDKNALDVSAYITTLCKVPGLQSVSCDPRKGECDSLQPVCAKRNVAM